MKEIKFTTNYEVTLSIQDKNFKTEYKNKIGNNQNYKQVIDGDTKYLALCPRYNNPIAILGIYKKTNTAPHVRHAKGVNIPNVVDYSCSME